MSAATRPAQLIGLTVTVTVRQFSTLLRKARGHSIRIALGNHLLRYSRSGRSITLNISPV